MPEFSGWVSTLDILLLHHNYILVVITAFPPRFLGGGLVGAICEHYIFHINNLR